MLITDQKEYLAKAVGPMQVVVAALAGGIVVFLVTVLIVNNKAAVPNPILVYAGLAFAVVAFAAWLVLPGMLANQARRSLAVGRAPSWAQGAAPSDAGIVGQLAGVFQVRLIVASAVLEGAAFFNLVAYLIEAHYLSLVVAFVLVMIMVTQFPTYQRLEDWVSHELESIEQMRV